MPVLRALRRSLPVVSAGILLMVAAFAPAKGRAEQPPAHAGPDWPRWRGLRGDGISLDGNWNPQAISRPAIAWRADVGTGFSSVAVADGRLYTMGNAEGVDTIVCLREQDGSQVWSHSYACGAGEYEGPRATPTVDGDTIYTLSREGHLFSLDALSGKVRWERHLEGDFGASRPTWGFAGSVVVRADRLYVNAFTAGAAMDKNTGRLLWATSPGPPGYATPVLYARDGRELGLFFGDSALYCVDLAGGRVEWSYRWNTQYGANAADPLVIEGTRVFITSAYGMGCAMLEVTGVQPRLLWSDEILGSHFSSPVYRDGFLYGNFGSQGASDAPFSCIDANTGEERWSAYLGFGSLVMAGGELIMLTERRKLIVAAATAESYAQVSEATLERGLFWTPPVLCRGRIYLRSMTGEITAIDVR